MSQQTDVHIGRIRGILVRSATVVLAAFAMVWSAAAQSDFHKPLTVAVMVSSDLNRCFTPGVVSAVEYFTKLRAAEINAAGGIAGRKIQIAFFNDFEETARTVENVGRALADPRLIGILGISSSTRGNAVIADIGKAGVPLISGMSRGDIYAPHVNAFAMEPAVGDEISVVRKFLKSSGFIRPAFVGFEGDLYAESISSTLFAETPENAILANHWIPKNPDYSLDEEAVEQAIAGIRATNADIVFLGINSGPGAQFLRRLNDAGIRIPAFVVLGRISRMKRLMVDAPYDADMYELGREGVPDVYNERLQQRIWKNPLGRWIFDDTRSPDAPESCKKYIDPTVIKNVRSRKNRRAIGRGVQHGDALMLMAAAAEGLKGDATVEEIRAQIVSGLQSYRDGKKIHRGWWQDWSFAPSRAIAGQTLLVRQRATDDGISLAPVQYVRRDGEMVSTPVVYIAVDMVRIFRVDSNEKTFQAEFYLSFRSKGGIDLGDVEFTNAFRSPLSNQPVVSARQIHGAKGTGSGLRLHKITGKFTFDPELNTYPFDRQRFSISFQPLNMTAPFFIQPPPPHLRKESFRTDGWQAKSSYIGSDQDIISVIGETAGEKVIIPLHKFNYTWVMRRLATDYYLQVLVPLFVILAVTFLSIFIPAQRLESVVVIQVTALLSSIALYLAIPKVDFDQATTSDIVFVATYLTISGMLGLSILRVNLATRDVNRLARAVKWVQAMVLPLVVLGMADYVLAQSSDTGQSSIRLLVEDAVQGIRQRML